MTSAFGRADWQNVTTKVTKSTKMEFDDLFNRVIGCAVEVHRFKNARLIDCIKRFVFGFLRALRVLRGGINQMVQNS